jgi:hypothetical protein
MRRKAKAVWERAYNGHALWQGRQKLGRIAREAPGRYAWEAAGRTGIAADLASAKRAVEAALALTARQMDLFG